MAVFFSDDPARLYQIAQWLPILHDLARQHPTSIVVRERETYDRLAALTHLPLVLLPTLADITSFYLRADTKVVLYVNNGVFNFQSLQYARALHVHVNHGESDKASMVSNQAKAYDRVFVAGEAAVRRHRNGLMDFDPSRLVLIGRPQLDLEIPPVLPLSNRQTVLYAPTWQGEEEGNNYTSVDVYGAAIAQAALSLPVRFVYKPHPRVETTKIPAISAAHRAIVTAIEKASRTDPGGGHTVADRHVDVLALIDQADLLIGDVSSVALDFLYRRGSRPLLLTDRYSDPVRLAAAPISAACDVIDATRLGTVRAMVEAELLVDTHAADRDKVRHLYFGDLQRGESTARFRSAIDELVRTRDTYVHDRPVTDDAADLHEETA